MTHNVKFSISTLHFIVKLLGLIMTIIEKVAEGRKGDIHKEAIQEVFEMSDKECDEIDALRKKNGKEAHDE